MNWFLKIVSLQALILCFSAVMDGRGKECRIRVINEPRRRCRTACGEYATRHPYGLALRVTQATMG